MNGELRIPVDMIYKPGYVLIIPKDGRLYAVQEVKLADDVQMSYPSNLSPLWLAEDAVKPVTP